MNKFAEVFLGILTAMGGFVEIGEMVFSVNAGTHFDYQLLWIVALGTVGIMVYCEMAGRIAAVKHRPVFSLVRERAGVSAALVTLVAATLVNLLTCAAEIGGVALLWQLLSDWPYRALLPFVLLFFLLVVWFMPFEWIERVFGLGGLLMIVFVVAAVQLGPDWQRLAAGFVPQWPDTQGTRDTLLYGYFAVALLSSIMLPYETYFYASGGIEDHWKPSDITLNRVVVVVGFGLGALLAVALVVLGATFFGPQDIEPQLPGTAALAPAHTLGRVGLYVGLLGLFFAFGGAAIETALSGAYNLAQFAGWPWGKFKKPREAGRFALSWIAIFIGAALIVATGVDPVKVVEYSIVFSVVVLPFTYFPVLMVAQDKRIMGPHANGAAGNALGWFYLVLLTLAALAALPLFVITHGGQG
ncbi:MAG TPA: divalent metal cation transporter [Albitalea sp.]|uniref:NRAMP family divalent metal transporter n=1 Tax=Piscinibacter sp. TaxID=1903157 RepID=UPI002ED427F9